VEDLRGFPVARLPDLAWGAEAWALVRLDLPVPPEGQDPMPLLQVELTASDLDGHPIAFPEARLKLPALPTRVWEALLPDPLVLQRLHELEAGKLLEQARSAARQGDWQAIEGLLKEARQRFADNPWVQQVLEGLAELARQRDAARFGKEAVYSSRRMNTRLAAKDEASYLSDEADVPAFLRRKQAQGKGPVPQGAGRQAAGHRAVTSHVQEHRPRPPQWRFYDPAMCRVFFGWWATYRGYMELHGADKPE
jgi:Ca-activated chloride channel family protein